MLRETIFKHHQSPRPQAQKFRRCSVGRKLLLAFLTDVDLFGCCYGFLPVSTEMSKYQNILYMCMGKIELLKSDF